MATIGQSHRTRCRDKLSLFMPPLPGHNRGHVLPRPRPRRPRRPRRHLCLSIRSTVIRRLIPRILLVVPRHAAADLLKADVPMIDRNLADDPAVAIPLVPSYRHLAPENLVGEADFRGLTEGLSLFRRVNASQPHLVLAPFGVQNRHRVAVRNSLGILSGIEEVISYCIFTLTTITVIMT